MEKTQAWEKLHDPTYTAHMTMEDVYRLSIVAGYTEAQAQRAANSRAEQRLDAGVSIW